jgi:hypothetical protein
MLAGRRDRLRVTAQRRPDPAELRAGKSEAG